ncbi:PREDICTED: splicing factor 1 isoform X2 [Nicrophorus vespilloides]|uniref:Branchpoint-bridging protein n=1 Tax=Nicrophorus vespilloides TaxID=110193 RepID=A0ABM1N983_NICVS|nr:PREDICTED: splicing factor 1 isoform X2 [Nicrophorus vespilloides]
MGSSRHRDRSKDRDRDKDKYRDKDRDRREKRRSRERDRDRDRERDRDRGRERHREKDREAENTRREREKRSRSRSRGRAQTSKEKTPPKPDGEKLLAETLATIAATRNFASLVTQKSEEPICTEEQEDARQRRRKSRWGGSEHEKIFIPGMPTILPSNLNKDQEAAYLLQLQIEEVSRKLRSGDLGIPANPEERSPSPEPIYSSDGKRLNTREFRTRRRLEEDRHNLVIKMQSINPDFKPPVDYKPPVIRVSDKVMIPQEEHPEINFVGLLIGPRGNTLKTMEKETGAKIIIRGKGSVKEGKVGRKDGQPLPGEDEPLHAYITATNPEHVKKAVERIKEIIRQGVEVPENQNDLRRMQLRELAQLNGTLRENDGMRCNNCGASDHKSWLCPDKPNVTNNIVCSSCGAAGHIARDCRQKRPGLGGPQAAGDKAKIDEEYMSLMAELGEGPPPDFVRNGGGSNSSGSSNSRKNTVNMFDPQTAPRQLMPPPLANPPMMAAMPGMPPPWQNSNMGWQPGPPGVMPPPPPPGASSPPQMMPWMNNAQPPPPGAGSNGGNLMAPTTMGWPAPFPWPPGSCPPPPPPGIDMTSLLSAPPPPPPSST